MNSYSKDEALMDYAINVIKEEMELDRKYREHVKYSGNHPSWGSGMRLMNKARFNRARLMLNEVLLKQVKEED